MDAAADGWQRHPPRLTTRQPTVPGTLPGGEIGIRPQEPVDPFRLVLDWATSNPAADGELARECLEQDSRWWSLPPVIQEELLA